MKKSIQFTVLLTVLFMAKIQAQQNVGIGTASPDASALLHINSATKGILIPKMTTAQKNALVSPAFGLMIFQTDSVTGLYYNSGTSGSPVWDRMVTSKSTWQLGGNAGTIPGTHFVGTTDVSDLRFRINNVHAGLIDADRLFFGYKAGNTTTTTKNNTTIGDSSLMNVTTGD